MLDVYKTKLQKLHGKSDLLNEQAQRHRSDLESLKGKEEVEQKVLLLIQESAKDIQEQVVLHITEVVDVALNTLFPNRYQFKIDFVTKANKTNADMYLLENGFRVPARGGLADLLTVALRMAVWSLSQTDAVLILDEPMLGIAQEARPITAELLKQLADDLEIQIILVSHTDEFINIADKVYKL